MEHIVSVARYCGLELNTGQFEQLARYGEWLRSEAHRAGGIGPDELDRLERRHLADSLTFALGLSPTPSTVWDLGTGVGLPGVPLAIALPETEFELIDRSGRRVDLTRRALRILGLENCRVTQGEIGDLTGRVDAIVSRATLPPAQLLTAAKPLLMSEGVVIIGGSWETRPEHDGWDTLEIPPEVLDQPVWLLIMRQT